MITDKIFYGVIVYCVIREIVFQITVQRLINKLMSRNYHEFQMAQNAGKLEKPFSSPNMNDVDLPEDLRVMNGIS